MIWHMKRYILVKFWNFLCSPYIFAFSSSTNFNDKKRPLNLNRIGKKLTQTIIFT